MEAYERRLIVDRAFDRTVEAVIDAFLREGFTITPVDAGDLRHRPVSGEPLRFAVAEASLPGLLPVGPRAATGDSPLLGCKIAVYELVGSCTLVIATAPSLVYPTLASMAPGLRERINGALRTLTRAGTGIVAA
jgi:hypothetical protein